MIRRATAAMFLAVGVGTGPAAGWDQRARRSTTSPPSIVNNAIQGMSIGITWDQARHVLERAVARGLARKQVTANARIGVDEKAFRKGHRYLTSGAREVVTHAVSSPRLLPAGRYGSLRTSG